MFQPRASPFRLELVEVSAVRVGMLACEVQISSSNVIQCTVASKPLRAVLSRQSSHPRAVHRSWPKSDMLSMSRICSSQSLLDAALLRFIRRFEISFYSAAYITFLRNLASTIRVGGCRGKPQSQISRSEFWLSIGFHPALERIVPRAVASLQQHSAWQAAWASCWAKFQVPVVRIAWRNSLPSMADFVQQRGW